MNKKWIKLLSIPLLSLSLMACTASADEQAVNGIERAKTIFIEDARNTNEQVEHIEFYKPNGFQVEENSDETNIVLKQGSNTYVMFLNPNEDLDSTLFYDLLQAEIDVDIVELERFSYNQRFGFAAVVKKSDDQYELITSMGGIKLSTLSSPSSIDANLENMMSIVRSVNEVEEK